MSYAIKKFCKSLSVNQICKSSIHKGVTCAGDPSGCGGNTCSFEACGFIAGCCQENTDTCGELILILENFLFLQVSLSFTNPRKRFRNGIFQYGGSDFQPSDSWSLCLPRIVPDKFHLQCLQSRWLQCPIT